MYNERLSHINTMFDEISESISRTHNNTSNTKSYSIHFVEDKDLYLRELEEENTRLREELAKSNKYAEALFGQSFTAVALMDRDYNFIRVNEMYAQEDSRNVDDFPGHNHFEFYPSQTRRELFDDVVKTKKTYRAFATPFIFSDPKGKVTYWDWTLDPVLDTKGEVELLILNLNDVTKHIRDKAKLAESEERYRVIYENSLDGILLTTPEGDVISANPAACSMFGASEEDLRGLGRNKMVDLEDPKTEIAFEKRRISGSYFSELTHIRKDGSKFPTEVSSKLFKDSKGRILSSVIIRDISDRKQSDAALRWSEEKFSQAFGNNQAAMSFTRLKDNILIDFNRKFLELFGYSREGLIGKTSIDFWVDPKDRENMLQEVHKVGYVENFEIQYRKGTGREVGSLLAAASILDIEGEKYVLCSMIDITERKKFEEALRLSQEQFFKAFNANPLLMGIISIKHGTILEVNETIAQVNQSKREDLIGFKLVDVAIGCDSDILRECIEEIKKTGLVKNLEINYRDKSGEMQSALLSGVIMRWKGEECILAIANDITALRRYEREMTRLDRLELIGKMSASIAHEIRNPMTTVKGFLQLYKSKERYFKDRESIDLMIEELDRANAIITEFLSLARNRDLSLKWGDLNEKIMTFLPLLQADALKNDINIQLHLGAIPNVMFDEAEIRQLLLNLVRNGIEAMSPGCELVIETYANEKEVTLIVKDQGLGIPPEIMGKIGTPFFTTKDYGTGLGLAVCYSIVERHHAKIELETSSAGTLFRVIFPINWGSSRVS